MPICWFHTVLLKRVLISGQPAVLLPSPVSVWHAKWLWEERAVYLSRFRLLPLLSVLILNLWLACAKAMGHGIPHNMNRAGLLQVS